VTVIAGRAREGNPGAAPNAGIVQLTGNCELPASRSNWLPVWGTIVVSVARGDQFHGSVRRADNPVFIVHFDTSRRSSLRNTAFGVFLRGPTAHIQGAMVPHSWITNGLSRSSDDACPRATHEETFPARHVPSDGFSVVRQSRHQVAIQSMEIWTSRGTAQSCIDVRGRCSG